MSLTAEKARILGREVHNRLFVQTGGRFSNEEFIDTCAALALAVHNKTIDACMHVLEISSDSRQAKQAIKSLKVTG